MNARSYDPDRDLEAAQRIWHECGWIDGDSAEDKEGLGFLGYASLDPEAFFGPAPKRTMCPRDLDL